MKVTFWGTRGSVPIARPDSVKTGGNTTCLQIESPCLPEGMALAVDAGSGFMPFSKSVLAQGVKKVVVLLTHYHHDHTQGLLLSPLAFMKKIPITCYGPVESECGPRKALETIMKPPFFPVSFDKVGSHFSCHDIENPGAKIIVCHKNGGIRMVGTEEFERGGDMVSFGKKMGAYPIGECLVIRMLYSNHPERTISYRFEERSSGKVFVLLTDHENVDRLSLEMREHLKGANLLVMDSQYSRKKYDESTAGFGHGTPDFCVRTAIEVGAEMVGLTHHDPWSTDEDVLRIVTEAQNAYDDLTRQNGTSAVLSRENIILCRDGESVNLYGATVH